MLLTDREIRAFQGSTTPLVHELERPELQVQPASVDLRLGDELKHFLSPTYFPAGRGPLNVAVSCDDLVCTEKLTEEEPFFTIGPGAFVLGHTVESVSIPSNIVARVDGRSSLGRFGLVVHATAGFIDPGFSGQITLEFYNMNSWPLQVARGSRICQISFERLAHAVDTPYGIGGRNKYQGQTGATASRMKDDK